MYQRKANRLKEYDYKDPGYYFVTICVADFQPVFGFIHDGTMCLNSYGSIVYQQLYWLEAQYPYIAIDTMIVMPNHVHVIICTDELEADETQVDGCLVRTGLDLSLRAPCEVTSKVLSSTHTPPTTKHLSLSHIVGAFKTTSSKYIHGAGLIDFRWHRSFYDSIIDNDKALNQIRDYIIYNPYSWLKDEYNNLLIDI